MFNIKKMSNKLSKKTISVLCDLLSSLMHDSYDNNKNKNDTYISSSDDDIHYESSSSDFSSDSDNDNNDNADNLLDANKYINNNNSDKYSFIHDIKIVKS